MLSRKALKFQSLLASEALTNCGAKMSDLGQVWLTNGKNSGEIDSADALINAVHFLGSTKGDIDQYGEEDNF
jgi:hypothetical protein